MSFPNQSLATLVEDNCFREQQRASRSILRGEGKKEEEEAQNVDFPLSQVSH